MNVLMGVVERSGEAFLTPAMLKWACKEIHNKETQATMFKHLGFTPEEAKAQFGFLMDAFQYGAPPHGGLAFGLDRLVAILGGQETIRDFIAFPKNNSGRDVMIDAPAAIDDEQLKELNLKLDIQE